MTLGASLSLGLVRPRVSPAMQWTILLLLFEHKGVTGNEKAHLGLDWYLVKTEGLECKDEEEEANNEETLSVAIVNKENLLCILKSFSASLIWKKEQDICMSTRFTHSLLFNRVYVIQFWIYTSKYVLKLFKSWISRYLCPT